MKKILIITAAFTVFTVTAAQAEISLNIGVGEPVYEAPYATYVAPDYPSSHYDIHRHRHNDYWAGRAHEHHEEHHARVEDHHDHDHR